jgi:hypothetical protein
MPLSQSIRANNKDLEKEARRIIKEIGKEQKRQRRVDFLPALEYCGWINDDKIRSEVQECFPHCCFNHMVGLPKLVITDKSGVAYESAPVELYPYEKEMIDRYESNSYYALNKVRGAGATEILAVRHLAFKYAVQNTTPGRKAIIIGGINHKLAIAILNRIVKLLEPVSFVFDEMPSKTSPTKLVFRNGGMILALPAEPYAPRGLENVGDVILDEAAFWGLTDDEPVLMAVEPFVAKSGARIGVISTPNGQRGFFWSKIFDPSLEHTKYDRHVVTLEQIKAVKQPTVNIADAESLAVSDPDTYAQEFGNRFILPSGSVFGNKFATDVGRTAEF